jgi:hypothetical protein
MVEMAPKRPAGIGNLVWSLKRFFAFLNAAGLSGPARKFVGGQAARGCAGSVLIAGRWASSRSRKSARSVVVNFHLNGLAAWL